MTERPVLGIGLMSGTSLDGMDAALVRCEGPTHVQLLHFHSRPYSGAERETILAALASGGARQLALLHAQIGSWAAEAVETLLAQAHVRASDLGFIAMHGQTVWHEPPAVSWQLGEPAVLAERFGVRVVSGFRARDVAAGGQGAPLVPMADVLLFGHPEHARVLLNIGGMANFTLVPRRALEAGTLACDTGPGVAVIDAVARLVDPTLGFDQDGRLARRGTVDERVLGRLLADPFFAAPPPKSTGRERFGPEYARALHRDLPGPDGVATAVELTARTIADAILHWAPGAPEVVGSGGGMRHPVLVERLTALLRVAGIPLVSFDDLFFTGDAKEAVAFALLGYLCIHGQPGNLPSATGAEGSRILGQITPA
ncbi:MAG TPA: anhydro-N-acetylmuramic acid kinase [Gemmatimonadales bacterium]|nr:anhydro-N-acetylmuramic acid kinase [Gemmatimonadales bacterium]